MSTTTPDAALDPADPYAREAQTFPILTAPQLARLTAYGEPERHVAAASLFERGERGVDFFVVLEGSVEIFEHDTHGEPVVLTVHGPSQFTGELDLFNDRAILVSGRATPGTRVLRIPRDAFRRLMTAEPDLGEIIMRAFILRRVGLIRHAQGGVVLVGPAHDADTLRLQRFLTRNGYPHRLLDTEADPGAGGLVRCLGLLPEQLPVVVGHDRGVLPNPETAALAEALGIVEHLDPDAVHDVAVIGAGPAGLAAAVYAASEGLSTVVVEAIAPGGQAGTSSKIENYLGFPTGISGQALAGRAQVQAQKFGARLLIARAAVGLDCHRSPYRIRLDDDSDLQARAVIIATGARYRRLDVPNAHRFEGQGLHYAATAMEGQLCGGEEVAVVGGGNSAGQAAVFLASVARHVHLLIRREGLEATMSDYLIQRIARSEHITLHPFTEITALEGDERLRHVTWTHRRDGRAERRTIGNVFLMIGAEPNTDWLHDCVELDAHGFVRTGYAMGPGASPFATSKPGIYAVGDVRAGSVKRVASGVGEGSVVVQAVHQYLHPTSDA